MTCDMCDGKKPKCEKKDFTKAVIEINNPETLVLLRKVVIPASMGTEEDVPAVVGKYHNVILYYEANKHVYIYSSDGIPTYIETEIPQEILDRIENLEEDVADLDKDLDDLQQEFDDFKNSPDVVDIVGTYADLEDYDTSSLGDNDIVRVLQDETHDGESTYYRWSTSTQTWTLIGEVGPYYTKNETDALISGAEGKAKTLTAEDYNWNSVSGDTSEPLDSVALWLLPDGMYYASTDVDVYATNTSKVSQPTSYIVSICETSPSVKNLYELEPNRLIPGTNYHTTIIRLRVEADGTLQSSEEIASIATVRTLLAEYITKGSGAPSGLENKGILYEDTTNGELYISIGGGLLNNWAKIPHTAFTGTDGNTAGTLGLVPAPATTDAGKVLGADGTWVTGGPTVVQTTGTSIADVMSQDAVSGLLFNDKTYKEKISIGGNITLLNVGNSSYLAVGEKAKINGTNGTALGAYAEANSDSVAVGASSFGGLPTKASGASSTAIGYNAKAQSGGSIALGAHSTAANTGEMNIGSSNTSYGYNSSNYRLLSGLYDGQSAHDAATKGQLDSIAIQNAGAPTTATVGAVGQLLEDTTNGDLYICTLLTPQGTTPETYTYTWEKIAVSGDLPNVVQNRGNSTTDVMSQAATTSLVYADIRPYNYGSLIRIGYNASNTSNTLYEGIAIGANSKTTGNYGVALGTYARVEAVNGIAIGGGSGTGTAPRIRAPYSIAIGDRIDIESTAPYSVAIGTGGAVTGRSILAKGSVSLGAFSKATSVGEMNIGLSEATAEQQATYGYNGSEYRLLSGLYDPQSAHDAATKGYCDARIINGGSTPPTTSTVGTVGTLYSTVESGTGHLYICTSDTGGTYTWQTLI